MYANTLHLNLNLFVKRNSGTCMLERIRNVTPQSSQSLEHDTLEDLFVLDMIHFDENSFSIGGANTKKVARVERFELGHRVSEFGRVMVTTARNKYSGNKALFKN